MTAKRSIGVDADYTDKSAEAYTRNVNDSVKAVFDLNGGRLQSVAGTANAITGNVTVQDGFTAYTDGLAVEFVAAATNTGSCTLDISGLGPKAVVDAAGQALDPGEIVSGNLVSAVFVSANDHFRLRSAGGTQNVTVQGGLTVKRSASRRTLAAVGPATALSTIVSDSFQTLYSASRVIIHGVIVLKTAAGADDDDGLVVELHADSVKVAEFSTMSWSDQAFSVPFDFEHLPGDTSAHSYEVKVSSTNSASYPAYGSVMACEEWGVNP